MKRIAAVSIPICGFALALAALAPAHTRTYAIQVTVKLQFQAPQKISGKVSSPFPACRRNREVRIQATDGSGRTELVSDVGGAFHGRPASGISPRKAYRVRVARTTLQRGNGHRHVCEGSVFTLDARSAAPGS
jgi:hypothetical protein